MYCREHLQRISEQVSGSEFEQQQQQKKREELNYDDMALQTFLYFSISILPE